MPYNLYRSSGIIASNSKNREKSNSK